MGMSLNWEAIRTLWVEGQPAYKQAKEEYERLEKAAAELKASLFSNLDPMLDPLNFAAKAQALQNEVDDTERRLQNGRAHLNSLRQTLQKEFRSHLAHYFPNE
jgi:hypothetical protein